MAQAKRQAVITRNIYVNMVTSQLTTRFNGIARTPVDLQKPGIH